MKRRSSRRRRWAVCLSHTHSRFPARGQLLRSPAPPPWVRTCASGAVVPLQNQLTTHLHSMCRERGGSYTVYDRVLQKHPEGRTRHGLVRGWKGSFQSKFRRGGDRSVHRRGHRFLRFARHTDLVPARARIVALARQETGDIDSQHHITQCACDADLILSHNLNVPCAALVATLHILTGRHLSLNCTQRKCLADRVRQGIDKVRSYARSGLVTRLHPLVSDPAKIIKPGARCVP